LKKGFVIIWEETKKKLSHQTFVLIKFTNLIMTQNSEIRKAQVQIGDITVDCYRNNDGSYYMSQNQTTKTIGISNSNVMCGRLSKELEALLGDDYDVMRGLVLEGRLSGTHINLIKIKYVPIIWSYFAKNGNEIAYTLILALLNESLERKADIAFGNVKSENQYNIQTANYIEELTLKQVRDKTRISHGGFQLQCKANNFPARYVHDYATKILVGRTATDSIKNVPVNPDFLDIKTYSNPEVGINHVKESELNFLECLSEFKAIFASKRPKKDENWQKYTDRVLSSLS
jgi:hypothetical protein